LATTTGGTASPENWGFSGGVAVAGTRQFKREDCWWLVKGKEISAMFIRMRVSASIINFLPGGLIFLDPLFKNLKNLMAGSLLSGHL